MNSHITVRGKAPRPRDLTRQQAEQIDRNNPQRKRVVSAQMDDLVVMFSIISWMKEIVSHPGMERLFREMGIFSRVKSGLALMNNACNIAHTKISAVQLRTMDAIWQDRILTVSTFRDVGGFINIDATVLDALLIQAVKECRSEMCMKDKKEAEKCPVKQCLDCCPNLGRFQKPDADTLGVCPYSLMEV